MSWVAVGVTAVSVGMKLYGDNQASKAAQASANYNAQIAAQNATIAGQQGEAVAAAQARTAERSIGAMIAGFGASGVQGDTGSPMDVFSDAVRSATMDNLNIKYNYALKGLGFDNLAVLDTAAATGYSSAGKLNMMADAAKGIGSAIPRFGAATGGGSSGTPVNNAGGTGGAGYTNDSSFWSGE